MENESGLKATIGLFELKGRIYVKNDRILRKLNEQVAKGNFTCRKENYEYKHIRGGMTIKHYKDKNDCLTLTITNINFPKLLSERKKQTLADLTPEQLRKAEEIFLKILERLDILRLDNQIDWKMSKMTIRKDFYTDEDPQLLIRAVRYHADIMEKAKPRTKSEIKMWREENVVFRGDRSDFWLKNIDKEKTLRSKMMGDISEEELQQSHYRMQFGVLLDWRRLAILERVKPEIGSIRARLSQGYIRNYLTVIGKMTPTLLEQEARNYFGKYPWGTPKLVRDRLVELYNAGTPKVDLELIRIVDDCLRTIEQEEISTARQKFARRSEYETRKFVWALNLCRLSCIVRPEEILTEDELKYFPLSSPAERIADRRNHELAATTR